MLKATGSIDSREVVAPVDRRVFGSFVEHMGRGIYGGIYEPGHPEADESGYRSDVLELVRELGVTVVRYPGGNFVSAYRWEDGVGSRLERPARLNLAWHSIEKNEFGLHEFIRWAGKCGVEPMLALNLGTRGVPEALDLLEYANHPHGTALSDERVANGSRAPFGVRTWCLGNEMDGPWQIGHKTAQEYGRLAAETARAMRQYDSDLELIACGSSSSSMPTFGSWEQAVLEEAYDLVDHISLHAYYEELDDMTSFLASGVDMDHFIERVASIADDIGERTGSSKRIGLSVDEWNVWYLKRFQDQDPPIEWAAAPPISEEAYTVADAVVVGSLLISLLKHADRVRFACLAQLVNVIAPIKTAPGGPAWREATFFPFALTAANATGHAVRIPLTSPMIPTAKYGMVQVLDSVATLDDDGNGVSLFVVNRHQNEPVELSLDMVDRQPLRIDLAATVTDEDVHAVNTMTDQERVRPRALDAVIHDHDIQVSLPPVSWALIRIGLG